MQTRRRDIRKRKESPASSVGAVLLSVVCLLVLLWIVIVLARVVFD